MNICNECKLPLLCSKVNDCLHTMMADACSDELVQAFDRGELMDATKEPADATAKTNEDRVVAGGAMMDTRDGTIYDTRALAEAAGVPDEDLVTGSRAALEKLRTKIVFSKGSFKSVPCPCGLGTEAWHVRGWCDVGRDRKV